MTQETPLSIFLKKVAESGDVEDKNLSALLSKNKEQKSIDETIDPELVDIDDPNKQNPQQEGEVLEQAFQDLDNKKELDPYNICKRSLWEVFVEKTASAWVGDVKISALHKNIQNDISAFSTDYKKDDKVICYKAVVNELLPKVDKNNFDSALKAVRDYLQSSDKEKDRFLDKCKEKAILVLNDKVVDGHHFLAKAKILGITNSLPVVDLTPCRFQKKANVGAVTKAVGIPLNTLKWLKGNWGKAIAGGTFGIPGAEWGGREILEIADAINNRRPINHVSFKENVTPDLMGNLFALPGYLAGNVLGATSERTADYLLENKNVQDLSRKVLPKGSAASIPENASAAIGQEAAKQFLKTLVDGYQQRLKEKPISTVGLTTAATLGPLITYDLITRKSRREDKELDNAILKLVEDRYDKQDRNRTKKKDLTKEANMVSRFLFGSAPKQLTHIGKHPIVKHLGGKLSAGGGTAEELSSLAKEKGLYELGKATEELIKLSPKTIAEAAAKKKKLISLGVIGGSLAAPATVATLLTGDNPAAPYLDFFTRVEGTMLGQDTEIYKKRIKDKFWKMVDDNPDKLTNVSESDILKLVPWLTIPLLAAPAAYGGYKHFTGKHEKDLQKENSKIVKRIAAREKLDREKGQANLKGINKLYTPLSRKVY